MPLGIRTTSRLRRRRMRPRQHPWRVLFIALALYPFCFASTGLIGDVFRSLSTGLTRTFPRAVIIDAPDGYDITTDTTADALGQFKIFDGTSAERELFFDRRHRSWSGFWVQWYQDEDQGRVVTASEELAWRNRLAVLRLAAGDLPPRYIEPYRSPFPNYDRLYWPGTLADGAIISCALLAGIGAVFQWRAVGVNRPADRATRRLDAGQCPNCRYPIGGLPQPRCPECGTAWIVDDEEQAVIDR